MKLPTEKDHDKERGFGEALIMACVIYSQSGVGVARNEGA
jgi:hypothetical protein